MTYTQIFDDIIKIMKKKVSIKIALCLAIIAICSSFAGCGNDFAQNETPVLTATIRQWNEFGGDDASPEELVDIKKGDVIYDGSFGKIVVKSVSKEKIVLSTDGGIIETEKGGGIDMMSKAPKTITIKNGEEKYYATQSMDAGMNFTFKYDVRIED